MKKGITIVLVILILTLSFCIGVGFFFTNTALQPANNKGRDIEACKELVYNHYPELRQWHDSLEENGLLRDTFIVNSENIRLHGLIVCHADSDSIQDQSIVLHGYTDNAEIMMRYYYLHYEVLKNDVQIDPINFFYNDLTPDEYEQILQQSTLPTQTMD